MEAVLPPSIRKSSYAHLHYTTTVNAAYDTYKRLIDAGIPKEDARYVIPTGTKCRLMMTIDARNLVNFLNNRLCSHAQWEIRGVAVKMYNHLKKAAPHLAAYLTPPCADCTCSLKHIKGDK
jgi:thymidylate synthase (FAD)